MGAVLASHVSQGSMKQTKSTVSSSSMSSCESVNSAMIFTLLAERVHRVPARRVFLVTGRQANYSVQLVPRQMPQGFQGECSLSYTHQGCILRELCAGSVP